MRLIAIVVFALAVTGATLAGSGLVVAPHIDPPGTPKYHDHVLAAYRLPIFLANMQARFDPRRGVLTEHFSDAATFAFVLGLLIFAFVCRGFSRNPLSHWKSLSLIIVRRMTPPTWREVLVSGGSCWKTI